MKRVVCLALGLLLVVAGCAQPAAKNGDPALQEMKLSQLHLAANESFVVADYVQDTLLLLVYDTEKRDPREEESLQAPARFYVKYVLYDLEKQSVTKEFPLGAFGHILSSIGSYGGVLFTWVTDNDSKEAASSLSFVDENGRRKIDDLAITKFASDVSFCRSQDGVLFSYRNELTDGAYGVKRINSDLMVEPLLTFEADTADHRGGEIAAAQDRYLYAMGEQDPVTLYFGGADKKATPFRLPPGEQLYSFAVTQDWIFLCKRLPIPKGGTYYLERYDWQGNAIERLELTMPLHGLKATMDNQVCGISLQTPLSLFSLSDRLQAEPLDTGMIASGFNSIFTNGKQFIVVNDGEQGPQLWQFPARTPRTN